MSHPRARFFAGVKAIALNFYRDNGLDLAATVSFYTLLSIGPLIYLAGAMVGPWVEDGDAFEAALGYISAFLPPEAATALVHVSANTVRGKGLVLVALPALLWVSSSAFYALEYAVNVAFATARLRVGWRSRLKAFAVLGGGWLLLSGSILVSGLLPNLVAMADELGLSFVSTGIGRFVSPAVLPLVTFLTFGLFYKLLPRGRVRWRAAAIGAVAALVLWELARRLFGGFLLRSPTLGLLTGTVAGVVTFLLWIYTSVTIVMLGAELAALLNGNRTPAYGPKRTGFRVFARRETP